MPTDGDQVRVVAKALGTPLIPWQQYVADVAGERRPDGSYEHQIVVVSVPRQTGKTTLMRAVGVHRCLVHGRDVFYTAQTGKDARERWADLVKQLRVSALKDRVQVRKAAGSERVTFPGGAEFRVFAPTAESLHGYTPPTVMLDEAFAHTEAEGEILMGAIGPAQITVTDRQLWIVSTAGTADSLFLKKWLQRGVEGAPRVACFVWAAAEGLDPFAAETIEAFHPGVGFELNGKTLEAADVLSQAEHNSRAEYERAYLNRWTVTASHLIPAEVWARLEVDAAPPADTRLVVLGYAVAYDRQSATIVAGWVHDGKPHTRVVMAAPGTSWLAGTVADLVDEWHPMDVVARDAGPDRDIIDQLTRAGVASTTLTTREFSTATSGLLNRIDEQLLTHAGDELLATAVAGLVTRETEDGLIFSGRHSVGDVSAAIAVTNVVHQLARALPDEQPVIYVGGAA